MVDIKMMCTGSIEFIVGGKSILIVMDVRGIRRFSTGHPISGAEYDKIDNEHHRGNFIRIIGVDDIWS